jgi:hypothetical protein
MVTICSHTNPPISVGINLKYTSHNKPWASSSLKTVTDVGTRDSNLSNQKFIIIIFKIKPTLSLFLL